MRALCSSPLARADEDFAVFIALFAVKFVNRHEHRITTRLPVLKTEAFPTIPTIPIPSNQRVFALPLAAETARELASRHCCIASAA
jgi:hypothetical protein